MNQTFSFPEKQADDPRILEYMEFAKAIGDDLLKKFENIVENARKVKQVLAGHKDPIRTAIMLIISRNYMEEFQGRWPKMSRYEVLRHSSETAIRVFEHLEYLRSLDRRYQIGMIRRKERNQAIKKGKFSGKFPKNFIPPPDRDAVIADSLPQEDWLRAVMKKPSRLEKLRRDNEAAWAHARKTGKFPKIETMEFEALRRIEGELR